MNKLSGYKLFRLASGQDLELKFGNGATELFGGHMGFDTLDEIQDALTPKTKPGEDAEGKPVEVPILSIGYLKAIRTLVFAAAEYAALVQDKPFPHTVWEASEWVEEIGMDKIFALMGENAAPEATKKKERAKISQ